MSHVATGTCRIHDLDALEIAAERLGFELRRGQTEYAWFGRFLNDSAVGRDAIKQGAKAEDFGKCDHALRLKNHKSGDYEIGIKPALDGNGLRLEYDQWGAGHKLAEMVGGTDATKLQDEYNLAVAARRLARQGYKVTRRVNQETGEQQVVALKA
jgi:hypothetical protein